MLTLLKNNNLDQSQLLDLPEGFTLSDDKEWQQQMKDIFCEFLPGPRTFCGDEFYQISTTPMRIITGVGQEQTVSRSKNTSAAVLRRYVRWRSKSNFAARLIDIDVDAIGCWDKWSEWGLPEPTITEINPMSRHHHWLYFLEQWCFDENEYMRVRSTLNTHVREGRDRNCNPTMPSPLFKITIRKGIPRKNSSQNKDGIWQADYHYVKSTDKVYGLSELLEGCRLKTVTPVEPVEYVRPEPIGDVEGWRNEWMRAKSFPLLCSAYRKGQRDLKVLFQIARETTGTLPDREIRDRVSCFLRYADGPGHRSIMSFIDWSEQPKPFEGRKRWSDNHISWDTIAAKFGLTKKQARCRFGSYEDGLDQYLSLLRLEIKKEDVDVSLLML